MDLSIIGLPWGPGPPLAWTPLQGPHLLPGACSSLGFPLPAASFKAYPPLPAWGPPWYAGVYLSAVVLHGQQENLCSSAWSTSSPCFSTDRAYAHIIITHLSHSYCTVGFTLFLVRCHRGTTSFADWLSFGQYPVCFGDDWKWLCLTWGQLLNSSHKATPATKTLLCKPSIIS